MGHNSFLEPLHTCAVTIHSLRLSLPSILEFILEALTGVFQALFSGTSAVRVPCLADERNRARMNLENIN